MYLWKTYVKNNFSFYQEQKKSIFLFRVVIKSLPSEGSFGPKLIKTLFNDNSAKYEGKKTQNLSLSEYLDEVYFNLVDFINKVKETSITRKIWLTLKLMLKLSKSPDDERELLRSE